MSCTCAVELPLQPARLSALFAALPKHPHRLLLPTLSARGARMRVKLICSEINVVSRRKEKIMKAPTLVLSVMLLAAQAFAQDKPQTQPQDKQQEYYRTPVPDTARWHLFQAGTAKKWTFLLDKYTGRAWVRVRDDNKRLKWQRTTVEGNMPNLPANKINYQIFLSQHGEAGFFLLCIEDGSTWFMGEDEEKKLGWRNIARE